VITDETCDPDAVLLINRETERPEQLAGVLERIAALVLAQQFALGGVPAGKMNEL